MPIEQIDLVNLVFSYSLSSLFLQGRSYSVPGYAVLQDEWISRHVKGWYGRESVPQWHTKLVQLSFVQIVLL